MAIDDLITRIENDAAVEAEQLAAAAESEAAAIVSHAVATAESERAATMQRAVVAASNETATVLANARLKARDELLARKRIQAERVLERAQHALETLPDAEYLELIASAVAQRAVDGDRLAVAEADAQRLAGLKERLAAVGVDVTVAAEAAAQGRGALLTGDRVRLEVSPASLVAEQREHLLLVASRELFGGRG